MLGNSTRPVVLFETGLPTRYYLPREDVSFDALTPSDTRSHCPYKKIADEYWDFSGPDGADSPANVAWSYSNPYPAVGRIQGHVAFYNEIVDIEVDGVAQGQPLSPFSDTPKRPGS